MNVKLDIEIIATERQAGDLLFVEGRAGDGSQAAFYLRVSTLGGELPQVGQRLALGLSPAGIAAGGQPSLRERMQGGRPVTTAPGTAARAGGTPPLIAARTPTGAPQDASGMLLSSILGNTGNTPTSAAVSERDVEDEMNALLGPPRRKG